MGYIGPRQKCLYALLTGLYHHLGEVWKKKHIDIDYIIPFWGFYDFERLFSWYIGCPKNRTSIEIRRFVVNVRSYTWKWNSDKLFDGGKSDSNM